METLGHKSNPLKVLIAFATIYIVWGSTYYFIQVGVRSFPPMIMGGIRFVVAGAVLLVWCLIRGEAGITWQQVKSATIVGLMLLLVGNGAVILSEQWLPSSMVAVLVSTVPFWLVLLDYREWNSNLKNFYVIAGLLLGFISVTLMFAEKAAKSFVSAHFGNDIMGVLLLLAGTMSWAGGSIYSKYKSKGSSWLNSALQMLSAGVAFVIISLLTREWNQFSWRSVPAAAWLSVGYLIFFGSIAAFSAYIWLLHERTSAQVSTYAYVNPVIAVLLGVVIAGEPMSGLQFAGLAGILLSVFLINLTKYRKSASPGMRIFRRK